MEKKKISYKSSDGITNINAICWIPEKVDLILQIAHGMVEYIERYDEFAKYLNEHNILVVGNDHLGHGESIVSKQKFGYFSEKQGNENVIKDMYNLTLSIKKEYNDIPYVFLGHSMGSFLLRQYLCQYGEILDGAIIMGTGYQPKIKTQVGMLITKIIAKFKGWEYRSKLVDNISFGGFNKKFSPARTEKDWLTRDEIEVDKYMADERCSFIFTLNGYYNLSYGINKLSDKNYLDKMPKNLPVFFVAGEKDPVGNFGKGVLKIIDEFKKIGMENTEYKLYKEYRHEILNEIDKKVVYEDILNWLEKLKNNIK